jgi:ornithine cyclodeaminase
MSQEALFPYVTDLQASKVLDYPSVIDVLGQAYTDLAQGRVALLPRQRCSVGSAKFATMGALWEAKPIAASKSYATAAGQFIFLINLFDTNANQPLAVMQAQAITRYRTAAQTAMVAANALRDTARSHLSKVAIIGAGEQGRAQAEALSHYFVIDEMVLVNPSLNAVPNLNLACASDVILENVRDAVESADIVVTATRSSKPVFDGSWLKPNAFVAAIGVSTFAGRELDDQYFDRAERVIVEWMPQSMEEDGDVLAGLDAPAADPKKITDLPSLFSQFWPIAKGIQVFKSVGTGLVDTACAWLVYQKLNNARENQCMSS